MANLVDKITERQINPNVPEFRVGDTLRVDVKIIEGKRPMQKISLDVHICITIRAC